MITEIDECPAAGNGCGRIPDYLHLSGSSGRTGDRPRLDAARNRAGEGRRPAGDRRAGGVAGRFGIHEGGFRLLKRQKMIVLPAMVLVFIGAMWLIFAPSSGKEQPPGTDGYNTEMPDADKANRQIIGDKLKAYEHGEMEERQESRNRAIGQLGDMFDREMGRHSFQKSPVCFLILYQCPSCSHVAPRQYAGAVIGICCYGTGNPHISLYFFLKYPVTFFLI